MQPRKYENDITNNEPRTFIKQKRIRSWCHPVLKHFPHKFFTKASRTCTDMISRCYNPKNKFFYAYGARGISVNISNEDFYIWFCKEMVEFVKKYPNSKQSVHKVDNDGNYSLNNIVLIPIEKNVKIQYQTNGNFSKWGTKLDDIQCLTIYTLPLSFKHQISDLYGVNPSTVVKIKKCFNTFKTKQNVL